MMRMHFLYFLIYPFTHFPKFAFQYISKSKSIFLNARQNYLGMGLVKLSKFQIPYFLVTWNEKLR